VSALAYAVSLIKKWAAVASEDSCWPYSKRTFVKSGNGACTYGLVYQGRSKRVRAHRLAFELAFGAIPEGLAVCHRCDNPLCCNPLHLFLGDAALNNADKMEKGRHYALSGERNGLAKLTDRQALEVARRARDGESQSALAAEFGISQSAISRIKKMGGYKQQMERP
jgi:uncharacterized protein YerC